MLPEHLGSSNQDISPVTTERWAEQRQKADPTIRKSARTKEGYRAKMTCLWLHREPGRVQTSMAVPDSGVPTEANSKQTTDSYLEWILPTV